MHQKEVTRHLNHHTFTALADPHRFQIVELLRERPHSVGEIADRLGLRQPQTSSTCASSRTPDWSTWNPRPTAASPTCAPRPFVTSTSG